MSILPEAAKKYIGLTSDKEIACDPVERGSVRRYAQAIMDEDPIYSASGDAHTRYGGPVAPPLYPMQVMRRPLGTPDPVQERATDPDFDGVSTITTHGLPEIEPLKGLSLLNGGTEIEIYRYARHGETLSVQSRYADITEKQTSKGPMVFIVIESDYCGEDGSVILKARRTYIRK